jgi:hypothetical protein
MRRCARLALAVSGVATNRIGCGPRSLETESYALLELARQWVLTSRPCSGASPRLERGGGIRGLLRKEVIQPQVPLRLPCYDFTPVTGHSLGPCLLAVGVGTSGANDSHGVTGGVYKARERIHPCLLIRDY